MSITPEFEAKLREWHELKAQAAAATKREQEMRRELFAEAFPDPTEGSKHNKLEIGDGFILQGDYKINRTLDKAALSELAKAEETAAIVDATVNYEPKLDTRAFKALLPDAKAAISEMVVEKPGTPSLTIVQPKR